MTFGTDGYGSRPRPAWLDTDWRRHLVRHEIDGRAVNVLDAGPRDGEPIVFVHGHSACWQHWLEQLPDFMATHRVIAPDLPGFGGSEMPADGITISGYGRTVDQLLDRLGVGPAAVVGNSMGGFVAAELAIQAPQRVERLVLVAAAGLAGRYLGVPTELMRHPSGVAAARVIFALRGVPDGQARAMASRSRGRRLAVGFVVSHAEQLHPAMIYELVKGAGRPGGAPASFAVADYDFRDRVSEIGAPTLIVWGDRDRLVPVSCAAEYEQLIEQATRTIYADTGHLPMVERPARFNAELRAFLAADAELPTPESSRVG